MNFAAAEAKHFDVAIALNVEANGIEIRQRLSFLVFFPVVRVAAEQHVRARVVIRDVKGTEDGHFFFGRMRGENSDLIKEAFESRYWRGKGDDDGVGGRGLTSTCPSPERKESPVGECSCGSMRAFMV